ncbi:MAG TPA: multicopper oxidase family protein [Candidatus Acidoferrum sp.]|nr:multicopper oxidase family protein [Candidatus Acidoferrum sp.]
MRRQDFVRAAAGTLAVVSVPGATLRALASDVVDVTLRAAPLRFSPAPGLHFSGLAYNGTIPGPLLRVAYGQRIRVRYTSGVGVATSIHWHGMLLPNAMDGAAGITQPAVPFGGEYLYDFVPGPPGTRWYHDHAFSLASARGLFGMFVVDDPNDEPAEREFALIFHDVPKWSSLVAAQRGVSNAPMTDPVVSGDGMQMMRRSMGDEVAYVAHCINGASYPHGKTLAIRSGDRVRLRILNASPTQTRYVRLAEHELVVTHADGNPLAQPTTVDVLRIGAGERYDAYFEVRKPGAFLLQGISGDPLESQQAVLLYTEGMENAPTRAEPKTLDGLRVFSYEAAGGVDGQMKSPAGMLPTYDLALGGGGWENPRWTIAGNVWPNTPKLRVRRGELVTVRFRNTSDMDHPMHLHGHTFALTEVNGVPLLRPLAKDGSLVSADGGTATWQFTANSSPGRWLLHCHNEIHMVGGMMAEVVYLT